VQAIHDELMKHPALVFSIFSIALLVVHFAGVKFRGVLTIIALILVVVAFLFGALAYQPQPVPLNEMVAVLLLYGCGLFVFLSELLAGKVGKFLTRKRGEKWTKELDYIYMFIGVIGVVFSLNRVEIFSGRVQGTDIIAPLLLTTAIVIRLIRTRAEIGEWNKIK
jgi:hypothetical protein